MKEIMWNKIVIFRQGMIGDTLVIFPLIESLRKRYKNVSITYCTQCYKNSKDMQGYEVIKLNPHVKKIVSYIFEDSVIEKYRQLKKDLEINKNDLLIYLPYSRISRYQIIRDWLFFKILGFKNMICFKENWEWTFIYNDRNNILPKESERIMRFIKSAGIPVEFPENISFNYDKDYADIKWNDWNLNGEKVLAICPGSRMQSKLWPKERFIAVGKEWHNKTGMKIVVIGGPAEKELANDIVSCWKGYGYSACGASLEQTIGVLKKVQMYCGNDTGPMHLASLLGVPCVAIFSSRESPELWYPMGKHNVVLVKDVPCKNCNRENCFADIPLCIDSISVSEVLDALDSVMRGSKERRIDGSKVFILHTDVSPYRLPLFEEIHKKKHLQVYHCHFRSIRRKWSLPLKDYTFKNKILKSFRMGPLFINLTLLFDLLKKRHDVYIMGEDQRIYVSKMMTFIVAKLFSKPIVLWTGLTEDNYYEWYKILVDKYLFAPITRLYFRYTDSFVAYSNKTKEYLIKNGINPEKIFVGTQGLDVKQVFGSDETDSKLVDRGIYKGKKIILCVSYFDKRKGIDCLIKAYKLLNCADTVLIILGSGIEESKLKFLASGRNDVVFPGYLEGKEKAYFYSIADVFVLPTYNDSWGLVVNEAMMFGLPIITTTKAGCSSELINGNGFTVKAGNINELSDAIKYIIDNDTERQKMRMRSKEIISGYTIESACNAFINAIDYAEKKKGIV